MKNGKTKAPKTTRVSEVAKPGASHQGPLDPTLLTDLGACLDDPEGWLRAPNAIFEGRAPIELMGTPEEVRIRERIESARLGLFT